MRRQLLTKFLPEAIVRHVVEPQYDVVDLAYQFLESGRNKPDMAPWAGLLVDLYPQYSGINLVKPAIESATLDNRDLVIIAMMLGDFDKFNVDSIFSLEYQFVFDDLTTWLFLKFNADRVDLTAILNQYREQMLSWHWYSTLFYIIKTSGTYPRDFLYDLITSYNDDEINPIQILHAELLVKLVVDTDLSQDYRPLDQHFMDDQSTRQMSVFGEIMRDFPTLAAHYIKEYEPEVVLDYMLFLNGNTYLHFAAELGNEMLYTLISEKKPQLLKIRNLDGEYAGDIKTRLTRRFPSAVTIPQSPQPKSFQDLSPDEQSRIASQFSSSPQLRRIPIPELPLPTLYSSRMESLGRESSTEDDD